MRLASKSDMSKEMVRRKSGAVKKSANGAGSKVAKKAPAKHALKHVDKKAAKHAAKKAAKQAGKKAKKPESALQTLVFDNNRNEMLAAAYHHLSRAVAVISLLEQDSGGDLRLLLDRGVSRFRAASEKSGRRSAEGALCLLRAAEHLGMAGLYAARKEYALKVAQVNSDELQTTLRSLSDRFDKLDDSDRDAKHLRAMGLELARRAEAADHDLHLVYELTMAAHWICFAIERDLL